MGIKDFYSGCNILITGGTGFMGKVLIEKLIRSCPGINRIYVITRNCKEKDMHTRIKDMFALPLFDKVRTEYPGLAEKLVVPVYGDLSQIRLGLSAGDHNMLVENVSIIFHVAATVRFDEPLREAIIKNVRGTREVLLLAKQMEKLKVILHVSTTYCNCNRVYVEEKVYESPISWQDAILVAEKLDPKLSEVVTTKFLGPFPNTYTITKLLAEQIFNEEATKSNSQNIPIVIFRPSIVISSIEEPVAGWIDNLNGPIGLMVGCGKGVMQVGLARKEIKLDFMPVDLSIKAMIVAAYHCGTRNTLTDNNLHVYNSSSVKKSITNYKIMDYCVKYFMLHPFDEILWRPNILLTSCTFLYYILTILQHIIPAFFIDFLAKSTGQPQAIKLVKLQRKIYSVSMALVYFTLQSWTFVNTNLLGLLQYIPEAEKEDFDFDFNDADPEKIFVSCLIGTQKYLFNSNPEKKMLAKKKLKRLVWLDRILKTVFFIFIAWCFKIIVFSIMKV